MWTSIIRYITGPENYFADDAALQLDYIKEDGTTATYTSDRFKVYAGNYIGIYSDEAYYIRKDTDTGEDVDTLFLPLVISSGLMRSSEITPIRISLNLIQLGGGTYNITTSNYTSDTTSDDWLMLQFSGLNPPAGDYNCGLSAEFEYTDKFGTVWINTIDSYFLTTIGD